MLVSVPKEVYAGERRVALTPETASHLIKLGHDLVIESGAGEAANFCLLYTSPSPRDS